MSATDPDRREALAEIAALARAHGLSAEDIAGALAGEPAAARSRGVVVRLLGLLGGIFVFAGVGTFIALQWDDMSSTARIVVTLGSGLAAFVLALIARADARYQQAATPLLLAAAALEPTGMMVTFEEFSSGGNWRYATLATSGTMALQFALAYPRFRRNTPVFLIFAFALGFAWQGFDLLDVDAELTGLTLGTAVLLATVGLQRTPHVGIVPFWYLSGATMFLLSLFELLDNEPYEPLFLAAACGFVYLSIVLRSRMLLFVGTVSVLAYTGYYTAEHFADSIGWPLALIGLGLLMIGLSAVAIRLDQRYIRTAGH